jgi:hypothetical protein
MLFGFWKGVLGWFLAELVQVELVAERVVQT